MRYDFTIPFLIHSGGSFSIDNMLKAIATSGHGALDEVEGAICRVERKLIFHSNCRLNLKEVEDLLKVVYAEKADLVKTFRKL